MHPSQDTIRPHAETPAVLSAPPRPRSPSHQNGSGLRHCRLRPDVTAPASRVPVRRNGGRRKDTNPADAVAVVNQIQTGDIRDKIRVTPMGMEITGTLSFEEWRDLAPRIGTAVRSWAFVLGDWLLYGEDRFGPPARASMGGPRNAVSAERYETARAATGIDEAVLANYAYVARNVPRHMRREDVSWEHHRAVAKLDEPEQGRWLKIAEKEEMTSRRLRASIIAGRVVSIEELCSPPADPGIRNHIPPINSLAAWWRDVTAAGWLRGRTPDQLEAMRRDFAPVLDIVRQIERAIQRRRGQ